MRILSLFIFLFFSVTTQVFSFTPKDDKKKSDDENALPIEPAYVEGIVYALPRTALVVDITAQKTTFKPGPYFQFAKKYLGIENARGVEEVKWNISSISVSQFSEADPDAMYKAMDTVASRLALLPSGVIAGVNTAAFSESDVVVGSDFIVSNNQNEVDFVDLSSDEFYAITVDPETGIESMLVKSVEEKAREVADYIIRLRKKRAYSILSPSDVVPEDGRGYEVFVKEAQRLDNEYMALFVGKNSVSEHDFRIVFVPESGNVKNEVLFRFSSEKGMLPKTDITGKPIFLNLVKEANAVSALNKLKSSENPDAGLSGVYYRIPVSASITVTNGLETLYKGRMNVAQFGETMPLPEHFLNGNFQIQYNTKTGSIKSVIEK